MDFPTNMLLHTDIERARTAAYFAHGAVGQKRKYTGEPYFTHVERVAQIAYAFAYDDAESDVVLVATVGYLHDVLEDTQLTLDSLSLRFGARVADLVDAVSRRPGEENAVYAKRVQMAGKVACLVKICDMIDNNSNLNVVRNPEKQIKKCEEVLLHIDRLVPQAAIAWLTRLFQTWHTEHQGQ